MSYIVSLNDLSQYSSNVIASDITNTSNDLIRDIGNTSNDLIRDIGNTSNDLIRNIESTSNVIASDITNTSNSISNRITDLYTNDISFQQNVTVNNDLTVSGNLTVDGTTTSINTDSYVTEILEIVSTNVNDDKPVLKVVESGTVGNIIEVYKGANEVLSINNSGKLITSDIQVNGTVTTTGTINGASATEMGQLAGIGSTTIKDQLDGKQGTLSNTTDVTVKNLTATGGKFTSSLVFERDAPYFNITDTATSGGSGVTASLHVNAEKFYILGPDSAICQSTNLIDKSTSFGSNVTVGGQLTVPYSPFGGTETGVRLYGNTNNWGIYVLSGQNGTASTLSMSGNTACKGYNFNYQAIRLRTQEGTGYGLIYETVNTTTNTEECKFSVRASDGSGYFKGDLVTDGNMSVATGKTIVNDSSDTGVDRGIRFWSGTDNGWAMYMSTSGAGKAAYGGTAPAGYGFNSHSIRVLTNDTSSNGFIVENRTGSNNFSVRGSDGLGYLRGGLVTDGNVQCSSFQLDTNKFTISDFGTYRRINSHNNVPLVLNSLGNNVGIGTTAPTEKLEVSGNLKVSGTINGVTAAQFSELASGGDNYVTDIPSLGEATLTLTNIGINSVYSYTKMYTAKIFVIQSQAANFYEDLLWIGVKSDGTYTSYVKQSISHSRDSSSARFSITSFNTTTGSITIKNNAGHNYLFMVKDKWW